MQCLVQTLLFVLLSSATHLVSSLSVPEGWPWSWKHVKSEAKPTEAQQAPIASDEDTVKDPSHPGCFMRMPSGCPKKPMKTQLWRHDTWAEEHGLDKSACEQRKSVWDSYCDSHDAKMVFVETGNRSEPLSALQGASKVLWPWSKKRKDPAAKQIETEAKQTEAQQAPAATSNEVGEEFPEPDEDQPGCYMRMPSGCPKNLMRTQLWRHDTWAEEHGLDKAACEQRKSVWDRYCDSQDAKMVFVGKQLSAVKAPVSALQISSEVHWPWSRKRKDTKGSQIEAQQIEVKQVEEKQTNAQQAPQPALTINEDDIKDPSQPGCYMRMPSGCPAKPMDTLRWRHDAWAEQMHLDSNSCKMRRTVWNGYCDTQDAKMIFVPVP